MSTQSTAPAVTLDSPVGDIAASYPSATRSFHRHQIDFCCGGGLPLGEACRRSAADPEVVLQDIVNEIDTSNVEDLENWSDRKPEDLVEHIVSTFHDPLREELPRLRGMLDKVVRVHGHFDPERLTELQSLFANLQSDLEGHMEKEEIVLFPLVEKLEGRDCAQPIADLEHEHDEAGAALRRIRSLTDDYTPPPFACNTWRALWAGLEDLETTMHEHIHLENNILFTRLTGTAKSADQD